MSGRRAGAGEPGSRGARTAPSHFAVMQLFHELKQQFPALPDDAVSACIAAHCHDPSACHTRLQQTVAPRSLPYPACLRTTNTNNIMDEISSNIHNSNSSSNSSRRSSEDSTNTVITAVNSHRKSSDTMSTDFKRITKISDDEDKNIISFLPRKLPPKRPTTLSTSQKHIERSGQISPKKQTSPQELFSPRKNPLPSVSASERTSLNSPDLQDFSSRDISTKDFSNNEPSHSSTYSNKPPISPSTSKKLPGRAIKGSYDARICKVPDDNLTNATGTVRRTPAVRPDSLNLSRRTSEECVDDTSPVQGMNLSVNVNCSVDVVEQGNNGQSSRRHSTVLEVTPEPTWLHGAYPQSPRSYTSVNLTLRTPTTPPQGPIDICSSPASLTYTTSSFDRRQGVQSRLQITVGPGAGMGTVTATRSRPRSCYQEEEEGVRCIEKVRAESLPNLTGVNQQMDTRNHVLLISRQKERKEQLRNELMAGKERLHSIQKEIQAYKLENTPEFRSRLHKEIRHLQSQCERLTREVDRHSESRVPLGETNEEFYRHIYTGQRHPSQRRRIPPVSGSDYNDAANEPDNEPRWPCHICTFRNHPLMDKCEQCEMPRVLLVSAGPGENIHIRFSPGNTTRVIHSWVV